MEKVVLEETYIGTLPFEKNFVQDEKIFQIIIWASQGAWEHETHFGLGANGF